MDLYEGRTCYFKVFTENKQFPLTIKLTDRTGAFEGFVSKSEEIFKHKDYDFTFSTNEYKVSYAKTKEIKVLYIAITALERLKMNITVSFDESGVELRKTAT